MEVGPSGNLPSLEKQLSPQRARRPAAAILFASLLGLALSWLAVTTMPLIANHVGHVLFPDDGPWKDICSSRNSAVPAQAAE